MELKSKVTPTPEAQAQIDFAHWGPEMRFRDGSMGDAVNKIAALRQKVPGIAKAVQPYEQDVFARISGGTPEERRAKVALFMAKQRKEFRSLYEDAANAANERAQALQSEWNASRNKIVKEDPLIGPLLMRLAAGLSNAEREKWARSTDPKVRLALAAAPEELSGVNHVTRERIDRESLETWRPDIAFEADDLAERMQQVEHIRKSFDMILSRTMDAHEENSLAKRAEAEGLKP